MSVGALQGAPDTIAEPLMAMLYSQDQTRPNPLAGVPQFSLPPESSQNAPASSDGQNENQNENLPQSSREQLPVFPGLSPVTSGASDMTTSPAHS